MTLSASDFLELGSPSRRRAAAVTIDAAPGPRRVDLALAARLHKNFTSYFESPALASGAHAGGTARFRVSLLGAQAPGPMYNMIGLADLAPAESAAPMRAGSVLAATAAAARRGELMGARAGAAVDADGDVLMTGGDAARASAGAALRCDADDAEFAGAIDPVESRIDDVLVTVERALGGRVGFTWVVSPLCSPPDLADRLEVRVTPRARVYTRAAALAARHLA